MFYPISKTEQPPYNNYNSLMLFNLPFVQHQVLKGNVIYHHRLSCMSLKWTLGLTQGCKWVVERSGLAHLRVRMSEGASENSCIVSVVLSVGQWLMSMASTEVWCSPPTLPLTLASHLDLRSQKHWAIWACWVLSRDLVSRRCKKPKPLWTGRYSGA